MKDSVNLDQRCGVKAPTELFDKTAHQNDKAAQSHVLAASC